jgi:hypothetical protein
MLAAGGDLSKDTARRRVSVGPGGAEVVTRSSPAVAELVRRIGLVQPSPGYCSRMRRGCLGRAGALANADVPNQRGWVERSVSRTEAKG